MARRIIVFSDGTGNGSGKLFKTNVWRMYEALDLTTSAEQIAVYDDGVGSSSFKPLAFLGGVFGYGLKRNVLNLYMFVSRHYHAARETGAEAPEIFAFGFSRGAFTIRVLVGLIAAEGLLTLASESEMRRAAVRAYRRYRAKRFKTNLRVEVPLRWLRDKTLHLIEKITHTSPMEAMTNPAEVRFKFLGLWDTVGAYGMPVEEFRQAIDRYIFPLTFTSFDLSDKVDCARHAMSLDDERSSFTPILWNAEQPESERIRQVWFAGVHACVGGGEPDDSMSALPLAWIMGEAQAAGLVLQPDALTRAREATTPYGRTYDSRRGLKAFYRYQPRCIANCAKDETRAPIIHESVIFRMATGFQGYAPVTLPHQIRVMDRTGQILEFGAFQNQAQTRSGRFASFTDSAKTYGAGDSAVGDADNLCAQLALLKVPSEQEKRLISAAIFRRRIAYFGALLPVLGLVTLMLFFKSGSIEELANIDKGSWAIFQSVFSFIGGFLPGFVLPYIGALKNHSTLAMALIAIAGFFYWRGAHLKGLINERARRAWAMQSAHEHPVETPADRHAMALSGNKPLQTVWSVLSWKIAPVLFALVLVAVPLVLVDRVAFGVQNSFGMICKNSMPDAQLMLVGQDGKASTATLETTAPCFATGFKLVEGQSYKIEISIPADVSWKDDTNVADLRGVLADRLDFFGRATSFFSTPFRRVMSEPLFKPLARIDRFGSDEYVLKPASPPLLRGEETAMTSQITARSSGELFLYVNDAYAGVLPLALLSGVKNSDGSWRHFYGNNHGAAQVTVTRLK